MIKSSLLLAGILAATTAIGVGGVSNHATARFVSRDSDPDTDPHSGFWRGAPSVFLTKDRDGNPVKAYESEVLAQWTRDNLYFLFICPYEQLNLKPDPNRQAETYELWNWDVAEVFIGSDFQEIHKYKEFEVSPQGEWVDLDIDLTKPHHEDGWKWNSGIQVASRIDASRKIWYGFMRIPYHSVDSRPASEGNQFRINFFRSQGPSHQAITWQPPHRETFHTPEAFGTLTLVGDKPGQK